MSYFNSYIDIVNLANPGLGDSIKETIEDFAQKHIVTFNFNEKKVGLLHGQVQSGKTAQAMGIITKAADFGFKLFIYLTTDNVALQQQTLDRARNSLSMFQVYDETEDTNYFKNGFVKPTILILKKNQRVLSSWYSNLIKSRLINQCPLMIVDDEGDAASLNTKINQNEQSKINQLLTEIFGLPPSGIYLQVTATPYALLLQSTATGWKPNFAYAFKPGSNYRGGDDFYLNNDEIQKIIDDSDLNILLSTSTIPESLRKAFIQFVVCSSQLEFEGKHLCNMLVHPSHKTVDHEKVRLKLQKLVSDFKIDYISKSPTLKEQVKYEWLDLKRSYPSIKNFDDIWEKFGYIVSNIRISVLNSRVERNSNYNIGNNILIGGNVLGRGLTINALQIVYYTRNAKTPLADTVWQHQRVFGADRVIGLCRIFAPKQLFKIFRELSETNKVVFNAISNENIEKISIPLPENVNATRKNVIKQSEIEVIAGGVNYFPSEPSDKNTSSLDAALGLENTDKIVPLESIIEILEKLEIKDEIDWDKEAFICAVKAIIAKNEDDLQCLLIIRTDRSIAKGTGTLLSPNDRFLGDSNSDKIVLTMYRLIGEKEKGWNGKPLWVPNIKFPNGRVFWRVTS